MFNKRKINSKNQSKTLLLLYVACTKALHELQILYKDNLCEVFDNEEIQLDGNQKSLKTM